MAVYLETNALRKLLNYECEEKVFTSIFSIFELLSGMDEVEFPIRKTCLQRINEQKIEIRGPMIDRLFMDLIDVTEYNSAGYQMIMDIYYQTLQADSYSDFNSIYLRLSKNKKMECLHANTWLKERDDNIAAITKNIYGVFDEENVEYMKQVYKKEGVRGFAKYFWNKFYNNRLDENRLSHAEGFIGADVVEKIRQESEMLFEKYNFKLFMTAQAAVFAKAYFINGKTQNPNNASDLLHLLYLNENDKFVSSDKIYKVISEACPEFKFIKLNDEKKLFELIQQI